MLNNKLSFYSEDLTTYIIKIKVCKNDNGTKWRWPQRQQGGCDRWLLIIASQRHLIDSTQFEVIMKQICHVKTKIRALSTAMVYGFYMTFFIPAFVNLIYAYFSQITIIYFWSVDRGKYHNLLESVNEIILFYSI